MSGTHAGPDGAIPSQPRLVYETPLGQAWCGESLTWMQEEVENESVDLIITSPPFALGRPKEYGNQDQDTYVGWFLGFADEFHRILAPRGSLVIDLGSAWRPGHPTKALYQFELLIALCKRPQRKFFLAQDFYWFNPARLPSPAEWVTIKRVRVKDAVNYVWWLSKSPDPKADNRKVLRPYTEAMRRLIASGSYNRGKRPSGHVIGEGFTRDQGGAIPPNLLVAPNTSDDRRYIRGCEKLGVNPHPARFPFELPEFFVEFLTDEGDLVVDPFAGSNVTGAVAEARHRRWLSCDLSDEYVRGSATRFEQLQYHLPGG